MDYTNRSSPLQFMLGSMFGAIIVVLLMSAWLIVLPWWKERGTRADAAATQPTIAATSSGATPTVATTTAVELEELFADIEREVARLRNAGQIGRASCRERVYVLV